MRTPASTSTNDGLEKSSITRPTVCVRSAARFDAALLGRYPSFSMASRTASRFPSLTSSESFSTSETSDLDTPASRATS